MIRWLQGTINNLQILGFRSGDTFQNLVFSKSTLLGVIILLLTNRDIHSFYQFHQINKSL